MEAFFSPFVRGSNRKIQGLCSTKGPPGKIHRGFYFRKNTQFRFKQIKVTLKKNEGNNSGQNAKMPATKTMKPHAIVVPGSMLCLTQCQFGW